MSKDEYLITDAPLKALTVFAMPMILGSFFQQVYNMADSIIVGQFVGSSALAAVGACAALTNVFICVALGAGVGAGVLVSRYFGAKNYGKMKTIVSTSLFSFLILSIVLGVFGFCFSHWMMSVLQTPGDILNDAVLYPTYNQPENDMHAKEVLQMAFPKHEIVGVDCRALIKQHGSLHCVTMQYPVGVIR